MLIGLSSNPPKHTHRVVIKIDSEVQKNLAQVVWEPELHGVGYSEFIQRAIDQAYKEIEAFRKMAEVHDTQEAETGDVDE